MIPYWPGAVNYSADTLSRAPLMASVGTPSATRPANGLPTWEDLKTTQKEDSVLGPVVAFLEMGVYPANASLEEIAKIKHHLSFSKLNSDGFLVTNVPHPR